MSIITSALDNDFYKFTMQQAVMKNFPYTKVKYKLFIRNKVDLLPYVDEIKKEILALDNLSFSNEDIEFLRQQNVFSEEYLYALKNFKFDTEKHVCSTNYDLNLVGGLNISIEGNWFETILYEVPILAIINEIYHRHNPTENWINTCMMDISSFVFNLKEIQSNITEFGTRRRYSKELQRFILSYLCASGYTKTSNVYFAKEFGLTPVGTMAHEWIMAGQSLCDNLRDSQKFMLDKWLNTYGNKLNVALTDTIGVDAFLKDYKGEFKTLRHDSGCPFKFVDEVIKHCNKNKLNYPTILFSDNLNKELILELNVYCKKKSIDCSFGVGTSLTNGFSEIKTGAVIKMVECNGKPVAKLSDCKEKYTGDSEHIKLLKKTFNVK